MTEHTPAPWQLGARDEQILSRSPDGAWQFIADTHGVGEDATANAHLIAAAPELLEAAMAAETWLSDERVFHDCPNQELHRSLAAAIAKAKGES